MPEQEGQASSNWYREFVYQSGSVERQGKSKISSVLAKEVEKYRERILKRFDEEGIKIKNKFNLSNTITATISKEMLETLRDSRYVEWIQEEITLSSFLQQSTGIIQASDFWNIEMDNFPVNGTGETICIIDSGVDYRHDSLGDCNIVNHTLNGNTELFSNASDHPYANDQNQIFKINRTGFEKIAIHFDNITMEPEWDFLKILDPNNNNNTIAVYTGYHTDIWTPSVEGDTIFILLESDSSINTWGFEVDQVLNGSHDTTVNWSTCEKIIGGWDFAGATTTMDDQDPLDDASHGTHVAGIIASTDTQFRGVAYGSNLISMKVLNSTGGANDFTDLLRAVDWCVANKNTYNISVITMSLGTSTTYPDACDSSYTAFTTAVNEALDQNILVIAASGNSGNETGISWPACITNVTSIGASNDVDSVPSFSNGGPLLDLYAPGENINSTIITNPKSGILSSCGTDKDFCELDGTSMAAPHVAGAAALLINFKRLENGSILTPNEIKQIFTTTGDNITDTKNNNKTPRINLSAALQSIDDSPRITIDGPANESTITINFTFINLTFSEPTVSAIITFDTVNYTLNKTNETLYFYNASSLSQSEHNFSITIKDYTNNLVTSGLYTFNVDNQAPGWSNNITYPISGEELISGIYQFNVTWIDNIAVDSVWIEHNFTGTLTNYSVTTNTTDEYYYDYPSLSSGDYVWKMYANDTTGNVNSTELFSYSVIDTCTPPDSGTWIINATDTVNCILKNIEIYFD